MRAYAVVFGMLGVVAGLNAVCSNGWWQYAYGAAAGVLAFIAGRYWHDSFTDREE